MMSHEALGKSDDWYTPRYIFDAMDEHFDLDVAAPTQPTNVPCSAHISAGSLNIRWSGFVWMNPPYGPRNGLVPWLDKFFAHANGICLVPDRSSTPWFQNAARKADILLFLSPKVKFLRPDGSPGNSPSNGTVLMGSGPKATHTLIRAEHLGLLLKGYDHASETGKDPR
jgi:hypothetical protein